MKRKRNKNDIKLYNEIVNRKTTATITQLRMRHCGLNHYFHRFDINESPYCKCGYDKETMEHYLLECRNYKEQRKKLRKNVGTGRMKVGILLGDTATIKHMTEFIKETGRLDT